MDMEDKHHAAVTAPTNSDAGVGIGTLENVPRWLKRTPNERL